VPGLTPTFHNSLNRRIWSLLTAALICCAPIVLRAQTGAGESRLEPLTVSADFSRTWQEGDATVHLLHGHCVIEQGDTVYESGRAVIWRRTDDRQGALRELVTVYLEDDVRVERPGSSREENKLLTNFAAEAGVLLHAKRPVNDSPAPHDPTYQRALEERGAIRKAPARAIRFREPPEGLLPPEPSPSSDIPPDPDEPIPGIIGIQLKAPAGSVRRFSIFSRTGGSWNFESFPSPDSTPPEQLLVFKGGVNLVVEGIDQQLGDQPIGTIDLSADQIVVWTDLESSRNFSGSAEQATDMPLQVYLEGNIVIRQGGSVLRASQAYYDVRENRALLLNAELKTKIEGFPAAVRVRAQQLRQLSLDTYQANGAWITTSEMGKPGYRVQASEIFVEPRNRGWYGETPRSSTRRPVSSTRTRRCGRRRSTPRSSSKTFRCSIGRNSAPRPKIPTFLCEASTSSTTAFLDSRCRRPGTPSNCWDWTGPKGNAGTCSSTIFRSGVRAWDSTARTVAANALASMATTWDRPGLRPSTTPAKTTWVLTGCR